MHTWSCSRTLRRTRLPRTTAVSNSHRPLISRVEDWRANGRVRWPIHPFRSGPQSDSHGHDSSPRHVKPGVLISSTGLSWMLHLKGYVTYRSGMAFMPTLRTALGNHQTTPARYRASPYSTSSSQNLDGAGPIREKRAGQTPLAGGTLACRTAKSGD